MKFKFEIDPKFPEKSMEKACVPIILKKKVNKQRDLEKFLAGGLRKFFLFTGLRWIKKI